MKKCALTISCCAMLLAASSAAHSGQHVYKPYLSVNAGIAIPNDADMDELGLTFEAAQGVALTGAYGYDFGSVRLEAELAYQKKDFDKIIDHYDGISFNMAGDSSSMAGMINGYFEFANSSPLTPFLTAGLGLAKVELSDFEVFGERVGGDDGTSLSYQLGAGCSYFIHQRMSLDLQYRYVNVPNLELDVDGEGAADVDCSSHNIYGGLRFSF